MTASIGSKIVEAVEQSGVSKKRLAAIVRKSLAQTYNLFSANNPQIENNPVLITLALLHELRSEALAKILIVEAAKALERSARSN